MTDTDENPRMADAAAGCIDFRLNLLGLRVWEDACQLISRHAGNWATLGPRIDLPVVVPTTEEEIEKAATDIVKVTAFQYLLVWPGSDLPALLAQRADFSAALADTSSRS